MVCPDGVRLATRLWRPAGDGPWPVLLMRQPYGRAIASTITYAHPRWYADHGFLVAVQDVRGRGDSEGQFTGFRGEAADGAAAVRWARGLSGSNGRVGSYGFSYQGLTQLLNGPPQGDTSTGAACPAAAAGDPDPFPDCLAPAMAGLDERRHWASEGGAHWWGLGLAWALQLAAEGCRRRVDEPGWREIRRSLTAGTYPEEGVALLERHDPAGMGLAWLRLDPGDPAPWRRHPVAPALLRRPMLLIGGWHDPHLAGVFDLWRRAQAAGGRPALVVGPWTHLDWGGGLDALQLAFFRRHLLPGSAVDRDTADGTGADVSDPAASLPTTLQAASTAASLWPGRGTRAGSPPRSHPRQQRRQRTRSGGSGAMAGPLCAPMKAAWWMPPRQRPPRQRPKAQRRLGPWCWCTTPGDRCPPAAATWAYRPGCWTAPTSMAAATWPASPARPRSSHGCCWGAPGWSWWCGRISRASISA